MMSSDPKLTFPIVQALKLKRVKSSICPSLKSMNTATEHLRKVTRRNLFGFVGNSLRRIIIWCWIRGFLTSDLKINFWRALRIWITNVMDFWCTVRISRPCHFSASRYVAKLGVFTWIHHITRGKMIFFTKIGIRIQVG